MKEPDRVKLPAHLKALIKVNSNSALTKVEAGNGWEEQLCGMKSMALRGSGRPGRRDSIEEDSIFRLVRFYCFVLVGYFGWLDRSRL